MIVQTRSSTLFVWYQQISSLAQRNVLPKCRINVCTYVRILRPKSLRLIIFSALDVQLIMIGAYASHRVKTAAYGATRVTKQPGLKGKGVGKFFVEIR